jgi:hypothetical protein
MAVCLGYVALVCLLTWPLPQRMTTHLTGMPSGDTGVYVWNLWVFGRELFHDGHVPFSTDYVFSEAGAADLSLHNYTPLAGLIAAPLIGLVGIIGSFNIVLLLALATSAIGAFALARQIGLSTASAWIAGALFIAAPVFTARETAHFSLLAAAPLPVFAAVLLRTLEHRRQGDAVLLGALVAIATYCDAYYGIYATLIGLFLVGWRFARIEWHGASANRSLRRVSEVGIACLVAVIGVAAASGRTEVFIGPIRVGIESFYNPMLALLILAGIRAWLASRPVWRLDIDAATLRQFARLAALATAVCLVILSPVIGAILLRYRDGAFPDVPIYWRSSPRGVDLLAYFVPNPEHPWFGRWTRHWMLPPAGDAFPEYVAAFPLTAWLLIGMAAWRGALPRMWVAFTGLFIALSLGPFVHIGGFNTQTAAPWAILRYLPVIGMARAPSRFGIVAALGLSLLVAFWVESRLRAGSGRLRWSAWLVACLLVFELWPAPRTLYSAEVPDVYRMIATSDGEEGRVLELPTGIRDGTSSLGNFSASTQFFQTQHHRPIVGGYLSRVSERRKREGRSAPMMRLLLSLSEGSGPPSAAVVMEARAARERFLARSCVRFVVVDKRRASPELRRVAADVLSLMTIQEDDGYELLVPIEPPACQPRQRPGWTFSAIVGGQPNGGDIPQPPTSTP